jgi:hypothetical protein
MPDVTVFDVYRIRQALRGHLADGDRVSTTACDDVTRHYWALTTQELIVLSGDTIVHRFAVDTLAGDGETNDSATTLRVRDPATGAVVIGTFRKPNELTRTVLERLGPAPD